jgi:hypothetical protein
VLRGGARDDLGDARISRVEDVVPLEFEHLRRGVSWPRRQGGRRGRTRVVSGTAPLTTAYKFGSRYLRGGPDGGAGQLCSATVRAARREEEEGDARVLGDHVGEQL